MREGSGIVSDGRLKKEGVGLIPWMTEIRFQEYSTVQRPRPSPFVQIPVHTRKVPVGKLRPLL